MADEYEQVIPNYRKNYDTIVKELKKIVNEYDLVEMKNNVGSLFGINPFDLFILKKFIDNNNIKNVLELGAGTSSIFLDNLGINRTSIAIESIYYGVKFENLDLYESYKIVKDNIKNNNYDLLLIDCEHSNAMAKLIDTEFLTLFNHKIPIFIHDWMDSDKIGYSEQVYYIDNILNRYKVLYQTDLPTKYIDELIAINNQIDNEELYSGLGLRIEHLPIMRCSAILTPI